MHVRSLTALLTLLAMAAALLAACGDDDKGKAGGSGGKGNDDRLVVYSGREEELVGPLFAKFEKATGIDLQIRYAPSPELAAQMREEGTASPADVFWSQDAGAIGSLDSLLQPLPKRTMEKVPEKYRDNKDRWVGVTARSRVLIYNTDELDESDLPSTVLDMTDRRWKDRLGVAPTNASFEGFVTAMRLTIGDEGTLAFLKDLKKNGAHTYEKNSQIAQAVADGEVQVGLVNHYYLYELLDKNPKAPAANHFFEDGDVGNLVNISAVGILRSGKHHDAAQKLVDYLLAEGQHFVVNEAEEREYPLVGIEDVRNNPRYKALPPLESIKGPDVDLYELGQELEATVKLIDESGLNS